MGKKEKLIERLKENPKDFTFEEMKSVLETLGFEMSNKGKTRNIAIILHKPHPRKELLEYQIKQILEILGKEDFL